VAVVLIRRKDRQRFIIGARRRERVVDVVGSVQVQRGLEARKERITRIGTQGYALLLVAFQDHVFGVITCRDIVRHPFGAAAGAQVHLERLSRIEVVFVPLGIGRGVAVVLVVLIGKGGDRVAGIGPRFPGIFHILRSVEHLVTGAFVCERDAVFEADVDVGLLRPAFLGGDEDYAVSAVGAVKGRSRSVFEHRDGFDVVGVHEREGTDGVLGPDAQSGDPSRVNGCSVDDP